jgi:hypothetical protein
VKGVVVALLVTAAGGATAAASLAAPTDLLRLDAAAVGAALPPSWTVRAVRGAQAPTSRIVDSGGVRFLRIEGRGRAAWFGRKLALDPAAEARLRWRWRIPVAPAGADLRDKATDDAAARIFVAFDTPTFFGTRAPRTLFYTAGGAEPDGYARASFVSGALHVIRIAPPAGGAWGDVTVDPVADYRRIFGEAPPRIAGIGVLQDAEQTGALAIADLASLAWGAP